MISTCPECKNVTMDDHCSSRTCDWRRCGYPGCGLTYDVRRKTGVDKAGRRFKVRG